MKDILADDELQEPTVWVWMLGSSDEEWLSGLVCAKAVYVDFDTKILSPSTVTPYGARRPVLSPEPTRTA